MENLYKAYGELMIQKEIIEARINDVKSQIAQSLNQPQKDTQSEQQPDVPEATPDEPKKK